jgi:hypothetical protein
VNLIGPELRQTQGLSGSGSGTAEALSNAIIVKQLFTCPAVSHDAYVNNFYVYNGDYIYNTWMGYEQLQNTPPTIKNPFLKITQIPDNVIIMMESRKPNYVVSGTTAATPPGYKCYFQQDADLFGNPNTGTTLDPRSGSGPSSQLASQYLRIGTPHTSNTYMNVLCADGHIVSLNPLKSFFANPANMTTIKDYYWNSGDNYPTVVSHPNWKRGVPDIQ